MRVLDKIFVVIEAQQEEQPALIRAQYIAAATGASLHLFLCAYDSAIGIATFLTRNQRSSFRQTLIDGSQVKLDRLAEPLIAKEMEVTTEIVWSRHAADAIVESCQAGNYDLLMKFARNYTRAEVMFNHLDWDLMKYAPCPVMLVKTGQWDDVGQVLAAIDAAPEDEEHQALNKVILERASFLATELDFELHLVSAYPAPPKFAPMSKVSESLANYRLKMREMVVGNLQQLGEEYGVIEAHQHAIEGPVDWVIPKVSKELVAEFVVMGNGSRQGLAGLSIGSAAESILEQLDTNLLMVQLNREE